MDSTPVLVLTNHKGGVGKSTSSTNIAYGFVRLLRHANAPNCRVLLIDTDGQGHSSLLVTGRSDYSGDRSLYTVLMADRKQAASALADSIIASAWDEDLHVLPSSKLLVGAEHELAGVSGAPYRLVDPLSKILNHYAAVVIDTAPSFTLLTEMALVASTDAIVPVEPRYLETIGLMDVLQKVEDVREGWRHPELKVSGILVTKMNTRIKGHNETLADVRAHEMLGPLIVGVIPHNEAISYSHTEHKSIFDYDPACPASRAYVEVVATLTRKLFARRPVQ